MFKKFLQARLSPTVDSIMSSFTRTISLLEKSAEVNNDVADDLESRADVHRTEAERAEALAERLKEVFTI